MDTFHASLVAEIDRLLASGAINLAACDNDFYVPRLVYAQALRNIATQNRPLSQEGKALARDLARLY